MEQFALFPDLLKGLPRKEKSRWEQLREMNEISQVRGALLPQATAAEVLDVSRTRVCQLIEDGRLEGFEFLGKVWVCESDLFKFAKGDRSPGRRQAKIKP